MAAASAAALAAAAAAALGRCLGRCPGGGKALLSTSLPRARGQCAAPVNGAPAYVKADGGDTVAMWRHGACWIVGPAADLGGSWTARCPGGCLTAEDGALRPELIGATWWSHVLSSPETVTRVGVADAAGIAERHKAVP